MCMLSCLHLRTGISRPCSTVPAHPLSLPSCALPVLSAGETLSEGGFLPNKVAAASVLDVQEATDKKGKKYYKVRSGAKIHDAGHVRRAAGEWWLPGQCLAGDAARAPQLCGMHTCCAVSHAPHFSLPQC